MKKNQSKQDMYRIGNNLASGWGGECYAYEVDYNAYTVLFHCVEHGEFFVTTLGFADLPEYDY